MRRIISVVAVMCAIFALASPSVMAGSGKGTGEQHKYGNRLISTWRGSK